MDHEPVAGLGAQRLAELLQRVGGGGLAGLVVGGGLRDLVGLGRGGLDLGRDVALGVVGLVVGRLLSELGVGGDVVAEDLGGLVGGVASTSSGAEAGSATGVSSAGASVAGASVSGWSSYDCDTVFNHLHC